VLDELYHSTKGEEWINSEGWSLGQDACSRFGVTCDEGGAVKSIDLHDNNLVGRIPSRIWLLTKMTGLDLSQNPVDLSFEQIGGAQSLLDLSLSQTNIKSIEFIGGGTSLEVLDLASNGISGTIPDELFNLTQLKLLYLDYNAFTGTRSEQFLAQPCRLSFAILSQLSSFA